MRSSSLTASLVAGLSAGLLLTACNKPTEPAAPATDAAPPAAAPSTAAPAASGIDTTQLLARIKMLASDEFEGRLPGTAGEDKTVAYLTEQFKAAGLAPGNPDGSYVQNVPLAGVDGTPTLKLSVAGKDIPFEFRKDFVAASQHFSPTVDVKDSDLVFVGYGVQAPEYGWDDYKGLDVKGKTIVMLINDPQVPDAGDPSKLDDGLFKGKAMTYYGRWTYKYEIASRLGASAAIIVHETAPAAYPWTVVESSWTGEQFTLKSADGNASRVPVQSWITVDKAREIFAAAGEDFETLHKAALSKDFKPVSLKGKASFHIDNKIREVDSHNVIAKLEGSDPALKDEYIVYTAHWDHLGRDTTIDGDQIYNGAVDNASGTATLLGIADAFKAMPPKRSILFLAVTAEEQGLLGSQFYAQHPLYPLNKTLANINMDALNPWGPATSMLIIGAGQNTLEDLLTTVATKAGRHTDPDDQTEKGFYYRSDQFNFAKVGVPALYADSGSEIIGKPGFGEAKRDEYTAEHYHKPSDEVNPEWDLSGMSQEAGMLIDVGRIVADGDTWPSWKEGSEFKAIREASLKP